MQQILYEEKTAITGTCILYQRGNTTIFMLLVHVKDLKLPLKENNPTHYFSFSKIYFNIITIFFLVINNILSITD